MLIHQQGMPTIGLQWHSMVGGSTAFSQTPVGYTVVSLRLFIHNYHISYLIDCMQV